MLDIPNENFQSLSLEQKVNKLEKIIIEKENEYAALLEQNKLLLNNKTNFFDDLTLEIRNSPLWSFFVFIYTVKKKYFSHDSKMSIFINSFLNYFKTKKKNQQYPKSSDRNKNYKISKIRNYSKNLSIPYFESPLVSIIVPAYNGWDMNYRCIKSIIQNTDNVSYEIILADDFSTDETKNFFKNVENIKHIRNEKNLGFLQNCNSASKYASGKFLLFLNNDTEVTKNWLSPLIAVFEKDQNAGLVGSKLIFPNGKLQEAGGIIWNDATGENYGKNDNPNSPEYNYLKEVDYVSGACMMLRKKTWDNVGGFNTLFSPAYYEDTDLAFSIRQLGLKVFFQPLSVVFHYEGFSHGKFVNKKNSIKANQELNRIKFYEKWHKTLIKDHYSKNKQLFCARDRSTLKKTILVIDHYVPEYDKDAGSKTMFLYIDLLTNLGYNVKFIAEDFKCREPYTTALEQKGVEVLYGSFYSKNYQEWIINNAKNIDFVLLSRPKTSIKFIDFITNKTQAKIIYLGHDLHFLRKKRNYDIHKNKEELESSKRYQILENYLFKKSDTILTFSSVEKEIIHSFSKYFNVTTIPLLFYNNTIDKIDDFENRNHIMFVGGFNHLPNIDGVKWFVNEVFPLIIDKLQNVKFKIAGTNPPKEILNLQSEHVEILGHLSDTKLNELYSVSKVSVIPLRYGAGVKGKVIEAMSKGIPIVSTSIGIEGITDYANLVSLPQDNPSSFANEIIRIYDNPIELKLISEKEVNYINKYFNIEFAKEIIQKVFSKTTTSD